MYSKGFKSQDNLWLKPHLTPDTDLSTGKVRNTVQATNQDTFLVLRHTHIHSKYFGSWINDTVFSIIKSFNA